MKTWMNPEVEELEVEMTAGGIPLSLFEAGLLPGIIGPGNGNGNGNGGEEEPNPNPGEGDGTDLPGKDETTDGLS